MVAVAMLLTCTIGCQTIGLTEQKDKTRSIAAIAEESLQAAKFGQFETLASPGSETPNSNPSRPVSTRIRKPRPTRTSSSADASGNILIDEIFDQTDIREALQAIASQANVSIIVDDQVTGTVTTLIQNEPLDQALQKILLPLGHHYRVVNGQYLVCGSDPSSPMFSMIADRLDYAPVFSSPQELVDLLSEKNRQFVRVAPKRNMVIVEAPSKISQQIMEELQLFDRPVPQVVLEAMVVVVSPDTGFKFGTNVGQGYTNGDENFNFNLDGLEFSGSLSGAAFKNLFSNFALTSYFVRALEQEGYLSIRATPHVMAKNGEKAEISIARESFFSTQPLDLASQTFFRQDIQKVEAGISLIITPTIRGDNVTMIIEKAEVSEDIRATVNDPAVNNPFPLINRRQVSTTVHVEDGETVVIGGLMQNQMVNRVSRVPVLGNLPLIGRLFTQVVREEEAAEVVVFISPRIVHRDTPHPMSNNADMVQTGNEYKFQRHFPRDNGLEIGGPTAYPAYEQPYAQPYDQAPVPHSQTIEPVYETNPTIQQQPIQHPPIQQHLNHQHPVYQQQPTAQVQQVHPQQAQYQHYQTNPQNPHQTGEVAQHVRRLPIQTINEPGQTRPRRLNAVANGASRKTLRAYATAATQTVGQSHHFGDQPHPSQNQRSMQTGSTARFVQHPNHQTSLR
jgi:hypothetical protein